MPASESDKSWSFGDVFGRPHDAALPVYLLPAAATLLVLGLVPLRSWEYWWHLTIGRLVNAWGAVPAENHFLYTIPEETPSFVAPWLSDLLLYGLYLGGSVHLGLVVRNLVVAAVVGWVAHRTMRRADSIVGGAVLTALAFPLVVAGAEVGPSLFAWPLFALLLGITFALDRDELRSRWLLVYPAVTALWANLHSGFWMGAALPVVAGLSEAWRQEGKPEGPGPPARYWGFAAVGALAAGLLNPRGPLLYEHLLREWGVEFARHGVTALVAPSVGGGTWAGFWLLALWIGGLGVALWRRDDADPLDVAVLVALGALAVLDAGGLLWFAVAGPVAVAGLVGPVLPDLDPETVPHGVTQRLYTAAAVLLVVGGIATQPTWRWRVDFTADSELFDVRRRAPHRGVVPEETPHEAVELLSRRVNAPRLFHDRRYAGYILFHLTGRRPTPEVFLDPREGLAPPRILNEYRRILDEPGAWRELFSDYDIRAALLSRRHDRLVEELDASPEWSILMQDDTFALLIPVDRRERSGTSGD